jgi:hypothetical protein
LVSWRLDLQCKSSWTLNDFFRKLIKEEGCIGLVSWRLDLQCKSSWILNDFFTEN